MLFTKKVVVLVFFLSLALFFFVPKIFAQPADHILISHLQIEGNNVNDEYIKLYNPTDLDVDLVGWKLTKKTNTGGEQNLKTDFDMRLDSGKYLLIAHSPSNYSGLENPDAYYSAQSRNISIDNSIILYDSEGKVIDKIGLGEAVDYEGSPVPNPDPFQVLVRDPVSEDTDNNVNDFTLLIELTPTPTISPTNPPSNLPTFTPIVTPTPSFSPTITPSPTATLFPTPTPSSTSMPQARIVARFSSPLRMTTCYLRHKTLRTVFGQVLFPQIECQRSWY